MFGNLFTASRKKYALIGAGILFACATIFCICQEPEMNEHEKAILRNLGELKVKLQYLNMLHEMNSQYMNRLSRMLNQYSSSSPKNETTNKLFNATNSNNSLSVFSSKSAVTVPSIYNFLPHLVWDPSSLQPAFCLSRGRSEVSVVMGIPTVKRPAQAYLVTTLADLIQKLTPEDKNDTLIVVFIAEVDRDYVLYISDIIQNEFGTYLDSGLLEIISPPLSYYPDLDNVRTSLGDSFERTRWRSKQNLDYAFLMMYAYAKGVFYIQLEDDIVAKNNYLSIIKDTAYQKVVTDKDWFVLDFCQLGFIGKMFRCVDLPWLIQFFLMFYSEKPVDWLLTELIQTKVCSLEEDNKKCKKRKDALWIHHKPSLFQHVGTVSSLRGKVQKLKDKQFGKISLFIPHNNPPATVETSIREHGSYTLRRAYQGETFFWGVSPKIGDLISFRFRNLIRLKRFRFRTANVEYPSDKLNDAVVEAVLPIKLPNNNSDKKIVKNYTLTTTVIGSFNKIGIAESIISPNLGFIKEVRIVVQNNSLNWVILSEIFIEADKHTS